jgi:hypothetical protein
MSLVTHSIDNVSVPTNLQISNVFTESVKAPTDGSDNQFGNYFQTCMQDSRQAYWGSNKPAPDVCTPGLGSHSGIPCHSIWNNQTKRKGVVDYQR